MGARWNWVRDFIDNYLDEPGTALMLSGKQQLQSSFATEEGKHSHKLTYYGCTATQTRLSKPVIKNLARELDLKETIRKNG
jgi:hypothetical protein